MSEFQVYQGALMYFYNLVPSLTSNFNLRHNERSQEPTKRFIYRTIPWMCGIYSNSNFSHQWACHHGVWRTSTMQILKLRVLLAIFESMLRLLKTHVWRLCSAYFECSCTKSTSSQHLCGSSTVAFTLG